MGLCRVMQILEVRAPVRAAMPLIRSGAAGRPRRGRLLLHMLKASTTRPIARKQDPCFFGEQYRLCGERNSTLRIPDEQGGPRRLVQKQARSGRTVALGHLFDLTEVWPPVRYCPRSDSRKPRATAGADPSRCTRLTGRPSSPEVTMFRRCSDESMKVRRQGLRDDRCDFRHG